jgi:carboxypeptidase T
MKKITILALIVLVHVAGFTQVQVYPRAKIFTGDEGLKKLASLGIPVDEGTYRRGAYFISDFSSDEIARIKANGFEVEILIHDVASYYSARAAQQKGLKIDRSVPRDYEVPYEYTLGSMGGFHTWNEVLENLDSMLARYPDLITAKAPIGDFLTSEGHPLYWVKISDNPNVSEDEPQVLYTGMHHAREAIGTEQLLFFMYYLLENYDTDPNVKELVDNRELYFIPVVNPDGYLYNQQTNPNGGGGWRKNRRNNGDGSFGVDLNRNYGYMWGYDNEGSSPYTWDETYRGPEAFSEPETQAIRQFAEEHDFKFAFNYHSYGNDYLYPFGYTEIYPPQPDHDIFYAYAQSMTIENGYVYGTPWEVLYPTNGDANDWLYGEQIEKNKVYAVTPEIGTDMDGFWPSPDRIIPLCQTTMLMNFLAAYYVGSYAEVKDNSPSIIGETDGFFSYSLKRMGLDDNGTYTVSIIPVGDEIQSVGDPKTYGGLEILQSVDDSIAFTLRPDVTAGQTITYVLAVSNGGLTTSDTIHKVYGQPVVVFSDDCNTTANWDAGQWGISTTQYHSPTGSITDSPYGNYQNSENSSITLAEPVDLTHAGYAVLNFWAKWAIEAGWDYVQVKASSNGGLNWTPLSGNYTKPGNSNQAPGQPLYDGNQPEWVKEEIDLGNYLGDSILIRFTLVSDNYVTEDGFYFDDLSVTIVDISTGIGAILNPDDVKISNAVPNPASTFVTIHYSIPENAPGLKLMVYDALGRKMAEEPVSDRQNMVVLHVSAWGHGVYYYAIRGEGLSTPARKLIIH